MAIASKPYESIAISSKLYEELSQFNTFDVNGYLCENGAFSALISDEPRLWYDNFMFQYGYNGIITMTYGLPKVFGKYTWSIDGYSVNKKENHTEFEVTWSNGRRGIIKAYNRELPESVQTSDLLDVRLIDDRHSKVCINGDALIVFDINRVQAGTKEHNDILNYIRKNIPFNFMKMSKTGMRLAPCVTITNQKATLGFIDLDTHEIVPTFGKEVDASPIMDYITKAGE